MRLSVGRTWEYDGASWQVLQPPPRSLGFFAAAYDERRRVVLRAGGYDCGYETCFSIPDVLGLETLEPSGVFPAGVGCAGSAGPVGLTPHRGSEPWSGSTFVVSLSGAANATAAFGFLGSSETMWNTLTLPISMAPLGSPNCSLHVGPEAVFSLPLGDPILWSIEIPNDPGLVGLSVYLQGVLVGDPTASVLTSDALRAVVGRR